MSMISKDNNVFQKSACAAAGAYTSALLTETIRNNNPMVTAAVDVLNSVPKMNKKQQDAFISNLLNTPALKKSNFKILYVTEKNTNTIKKTLTQDTIAAFQKVFDLNNLKNHKEKFEKNLKNGLAKKFNNIINVVKKGKNAFYYPFANIAIAPANNTIFTAHEIGHAINTNSVKHGKLLLTQARLLPKLAFITPAIAIWQSFSNKDKEDKTFTQKHAGKIVALSFIPLLADEAMASIRAIKAGEQIKLPQNMIKGMKKGYALAFSTYAILAGVATGSVLLANKLFSHRKNK